jgi:hypothetical protein
MSIHRRAFATTFALFLVALVAGALLAVTSLMTSDVRRSTRAAVDAQLRELIHAGAVAAVAQVRAAGELPGDALNVALPRELTGAGARVRVARAPAPAAADEIHLIIDAHLDDASARLQLALVRDGGAWRVRSVGD